MLLNLTKLKDVLDKDTAGECFCKKRDARIKNRKINKV